MWNPFKNNSPEVDLQTGEVYTNLPTNSVAVAFSMNGGSVFDDDQLNFATIDIGGRTYQYMPFGQDDQLPYELKDTKTIR